jgi:hypothetical protein
LLANNSLGTAGYILKTNGTNAYWDVAPTGGGGSPGLISYTSKSLDSVKGTDTVLTNVTAVNAAAYLQVANANAKYATKVNPATSGLLAHTGRVTISTNLSVSGNAAVTGTMTATGVVSGSELTSTFASADEGGQINLAKPPNATISGGVVIDAYLNKLRIYENGGSFRGAYIDLSAASNGVADNLFIGPTSYGAIGTYLWATGPSTVPGSTAAGSSLTPAGEFYDSQNTIAGYGVSGTWRAMGNGTAVATLWLRVA